MKSFKRILLGLMLLCSFSLFAQEQELQVKEEGKIIFNPHWFTQIQVGAAYTVGEADFGNLISPAAALNFGYKFIPALAARIGVSGWQAKGGWKSADYKFNYFQGNLDLMLDLSNLIGGFRYDRAFDGYIFAGIGGAYGFNNGANDLNPNIYHFSYLWDKKGFFAGRFGLGGNFRISERVDINLEGNVNMYNDHFNSKQGDNTDYQYNVLVGLGIKLGKSYSKTETIYYDYQKPVEQPKPAPQPQPEEKVVVKEEPVVVPEKVEPLKEEIFFVINSSVIRPDQFTKLENLVTFLNNNPNASVVLTGYADKETGTPVINQRLSEQRAISVCKALVNKGIAKSRITTEYKGATVQPNATPEENRVCICIAE